MKNLFLILSSVLLFSCASYKYQYTFKLDRPVQSEKLIYENDTFSIVFNFDTKGLNFFLYNKSTDGIRINWDEVSISVNGNAKRVVHKETGMTKITDFQPPTTIPPQSQLKDYVIPTSNVRFQNVSGRLSMVITDIYKVKDYGNKKTRDYILGLKGQRFTLFLPYYIKNEFHSKTFDFTITEIKKIKA